MGLVQSSAMPSIPLLLTIGRPTDTHKDVFYLQIYILQICDCKIKLQIMMTLISCKVSVQTSAREVGMEVFDFCGLYKALLITIFKVELLNVM